jgi:D-glycero-D-manno-heptose 1,7-bisphosphate phosphatase
MAGRKLFDGQLRFGKDIHRGRCACGNYLLIPYSAIIPAAAHRCPACGRLSYMEIDEKGKVKAVHFRPGEIKPALVLDFDGTIRRSKSGREFIQGPDDVELFPDIENKIWKYRQKDNFLICGLTNQGGIALGHKTPLDAKRENERTAALFEKNPLHLIVMATHHTDGMLRPYFTRSLLRKPAYGGLALLEHLAYDHLAVAIDWDRSIMVGDREEDKQCADAAGIKFIHANEFFGRG